MRCSSTFTANEEPALNQKGDEWIMSIHYDVQMLRSKLIAMTRLTQRTVDYSIKAMQLGRPELCRAVHNSKGEMSATGCWIATHGRKILEAGTSGNADARFACAALRIAAALGLAHNAALEIAQQIDTRYAAGWEPVSAELEDAGQLVNSLLRLCVLSLLNRNAGHAKEVLQNAGAGHSLDLAVYLAHHHQPGARVRFERAIIRCLNGIADQAREIADAIILWLEEATREKVTSGRAVPKSAHYTARLSGGVCQVSVSATESSCKTLACSPAIPAREAFIARPSEDSGVPARSYAESVPTEEFTQARLMGLQQRVCELLVKNQQLRMALMAERADGRQDTLC